MKKQALPVYDITDFKYQGTEENFYANDYNSHLKQYHHLILAPHTHNFYLSLLFTKGSGIHEVEFQKYEIKPDRISIIGRESAHLDIIERY
jgi:AraC family transcriptional regulator, transcriptional activator of pobA